jgi:hypothetical protein
MVDLETRRQAIAELESAGGEVTPASLVEAARSPNHPLHGEFVWVGDEAVLALALITARSIIRSVRIEIVRGEVRNFTPMYVRSPAREQHEQGYVSLDALRTDRAAALASIEADISRLENLIRSIQVKAAALDVEEPLDEMLKQSSILRAALGLKRKKLA